MFECLLGLHGALGVGMVPECSPAKGCTNLFSGSMVILCKRIDNVVRVAYDQDLLRRGEAVLDARPIVAQETGSCAGYLEHACRWGEARLCHGGAVDVHDHAGGAVDAVVLGCWNMANPADVWWQHLVSPALSSKYEALFRGKLGGVKEKFFNASFTIGKTVAQKRDVACK